MKNTNLEVSELCERIENFIVNMREDIQDLESIIIEIEETMKSENYDVL